MLSIKMAIETNKPDLFKGGNVYRHMELNFPVIFSAISSQISASACDQAGQIESC